MCKCNDTCHSRTYIFNRDGWVTRGGGSRDAGVGTGRRGRRLMLLGSCWANWLVGSELTGELFLRACCPINYFNKVD